MNENWTDERLDAGLRDLFSRAQRPAAPRDLREYPADVTREVLTLAPVRWRPSRFSALIGVAAVVAAIVLAAVLLEFHPKPQPAAPTPTAAVTATPTATATASVQVGLPAEATAGGFTWHRLPLPVDQSNASAWAIRQANGLFFGLQPPLDYATGSTELWLSSDAVHWRQAGTLPGATSDEITYVFDVIWDGARYVAGGSRGGLTNVQVAFWTSKDGSSWTLAPAPDLWPMVSLTDAGFTSGNGAYVVAGPLTAGVWRSTDLVHWTSAQDVGAIIPQSVVRFGQGVFLVPATDFNGNSFVLRSTDGTHWTRQDLGGRIETLVAASTGFLALTASDTGFSVLTSADGESWSSVFASPSPLPGQCDPGLLVCLSNAPGTALDYSVDGHIWVPIPWPAEFGDQHSYDIGPCPDTIFVTVRWGEGAAIYTVLPRSR